MPPSSGHRRMSRRSLSSSSSFSRSRSSTSSRSTEPHVTRRRNDRQRYRSSESSNHRHRNRSPARRRRSTSHLNGRHKSISPKRIRPPSLPRRRGGGRRRVSSASRSRSAMSQSRSRSVSFERARRLSPRRPPGTRPPPTSDSVKQTRNDYSRNRRREPYSSRHTTNNPAHRYYDHQPPTTALSGLRRDGNYNSRSPPLRRIPPSLRKIPTKTTTTNRYGRLALSSPNNNMNNNIGTMMSDMNGVSPAVFSPHGMKRIRYNDTDHQNIMSKQGRSIGLNLQGSLHTPSSTIDRTTTCPFLLRVYYKLMRHHSLEDFNKYLLPSMELRRDETPFCDDEANVNSAMKIEEEEEEAGMKDTEHTASEENDHHVDEISQHDNTDHHHPSAFLHQDDNTQQQPNLTAYGEAFSSSELQLYTWKDTSLREIVDLVKDVCPEARVRNSRLSLKLLHLNPRGTYSLSDLGTLHSSRPGPEDRRILLRSKFEIGDVVSIAIMPSGLRGNVNNTNKHKFYNKYPQQQPLLQEGDGMNHEEAEKNINLTSTTVDREDCLMNGEEEDINQSSQHDSTTIMQSLTDDSSAVKENLIMDIKLPKTEDDDRTITVVDGHDKRSIDLVHS